MPLRRKRKMSAIHPVNHEVTPKVIDSSKILNYPLNAVFMAANSIEQETSIQADHRHNEVISDATMNTENAMQDPVPIELSVSSSSKDVEVIIIDDDDVEPAIKAMKALPKDVASGKQFEFIVSLLINKDKKINGTLVTTIESLNEEKKYQNFLDPLKGVYEKIKSGSNSIGDEHLQKTSSMDNVFEEFESGNESSAENNPIIADITGRDYSEGPRIKKRKFKEANTQKLILHKKIEAPFVVDDVVERFIDDDIVSGDTNRTKPHYVPPKYNPQSGVIPLQLKSKNQDKGDPSSALLQDKKESKYVYAENKTYNVQVDKELVEYVMHLLRIALATPVDRKQSAQLTEECESALDAIQTNSVVQSGLLIKHSASIVSESDVTEITAIITQKQNELQTLIGVSEKLDLKVQSNTAYLENLIRFKNGFRYAKLYDDLEGMFGKHKKEFLLKMIAQGANTNHKKVSETICYYHFIRDLYPFVTTQNAHELIMLRVNINANEWRLFSTNHRIKLLKKAYVQFTLEQEPEDFKLKDWCEREWVRVNANTLLANTNIIYTDATSTLVTLRKIGTIAKTFSYNNRIQIKSANYLSINKESWYANIVHTAILYANIGFSQNKNNEDTLVQLKDIKINETLACNFGVEYCVLQITGKSLEHWKEWMNDTNVYRKFKAIFGIINNLVQNFEDIDNDFPSDSVSNKEILIWLKSTYHALYEFPQEHYKFPMLNFLSDSDEEE